MPSETSRRVIQYFRVKARQIAALADLPICEHSSLTGGHREEINRVYLSEVLPRRFSVSRGMVYGIVHRSREADIVIWDAQNYPALPMMDHAFFFAESVRAVLEVKSDWSKKEFSDVKRKCGSVRSIVPMTDPDLIDEIRSMRETLDSLVSGRGHTGTLLVKPHIGTAAMFFKGGKNLKLPKVGSVESQLVDSDWPDAMLLLDVGRVVLKQYLTDDTGASIGRLELFDVGADALLIFTSALLSLVTQRSSALENPLELRRYALADFEPIKEVEFPLTRMPPLRVGFWGRHV